MNHDTRTMFHRLCFALLLALGACGGVAEAVPPMHDAGEPLDARHDARRDAGRDVEQFEDARPDVGERADALQVDASVMPDAHDAAGDVVQELDAASMDGQIGCAATCDDAAVRVSCNCLSADPCAPDAGCVLP